MQARQNHAQWTTRLSFTQAEKPVITAQLRRFRVAKVAKVLVAITIVFRAADFGNHKTTTFRNLFGCTGWFDKHLQIHGEFTFFLTVECVLVLSPAGIIHFERVGGVAGGGDEFQPYVVPFAMDVEIALHGNDGGCAAHRGSRKHAEFASRGDGVYAQNRIRARRGRHRGVGAMP